jgi:nicotinate-nucleotide pyrophosphorylase
MGLDKYSAGSFEEMVEEQDSAPETAKTVEAEIEATTDATPVAEAKADNVETPKTE